MTFQTSLEQLPEFAASFWDYIGEARVVAFHGDMGAGKTTIITALCKYKGVRDVASSPTFSIINEYSFIDGGVERKIFHLDLYRLNSMEEIIQAGVEDCLYSGEICFVEWPEKAPGLFPAETLHVFIELQSPTRRFIRLETSATSSS